jgi:GNAT superfamily N-acetyltransferase
MNSMTAGRSSTQGYRIIRPRPEHGVGVYETICRANGYAPERGVPGVFGLSGWEALLERFGEGQFVAVTETGEVIGVALALRTDYPPSAPPKSWREVVGDLSLGNHEPEGAWLYGAEKAVHPDHQGKGVGTALYKAQFKLAQRLGVKGIYAGGMLKGYKRYRERMSVREYAGKVMRGEVFDPTVSVQMKRGFKARSIIENYAWDQDAEHTGMLIVWETPRRSERPVRQPAAGVPARV